MTNSPALLGDKSFTYAFNQLNKDEQWKLKAEQGISDAMYTRKQDRRGSLTSAAANANVNENYSTLDFADLKRLDKQVRTENGKDVDVEATRKVYNDLQHSIKNREEGFHRRDDYLRLIEFGNEFNEALKYNSKRKVSDYLGFECSIPPKELTVHAKIKGKYQYWDARDKELEEDEIRLVHEMERPDESFKIGELVYPPPDAGDDSFENYYWTIRDWRHKEHKHEQAVSNIPDSALIVDGNVAFGKTVDPDGGVDENPTFERKKSTNSIGELEDADLGLAGNKDSVRHRVFGVLTKRIARRKSTSPELDDSVKNATSKSMSNLHIQNSGSMATTSDFEGKSPRSLRQRLENGRSTLRRIAVRRK